MKRMLINATLLDELRIAFIEDRTVSDFIIGYATDEEKIGNIFKARITSVEPHLDAAFVEFGSERHGFLPFKEISREYFRAKSTESSGERLNIKDALNVGQEIMVQVEKEERGGKGAALTTFISLAGTYLVLMPNNPRAGGVSRRVEGQQRDDLREQLSGLNLPESMGLIIRTAGVGRSQEELQWDLDLLLTQWQAITEAAKERSAPFLIHQETDIVSRTIRDYLRPDIDEIVVDDPATHEKVVQYIQRVRPDFIDRVKLFAEPFPLFHRYEVEQQIESAYQRTVQLPSGGSIVIDHTEALVAIDINSARATKGADIEETALNTNREAANEIARQLRLRDIGGLIVIDFIDMSAMRNQREIENHLRLALKVDRARVQIGRISRFGMLEMSRQRLRPSLRDAIKVACPRCNGQGHIRSVESLVLSTIRIIGEHAIKMQAGQIQVQLPLDVATYLLNEKRQALNDIEQQHSVKISIIPNQHLESPHYRIRRLNETKSAGVQHKPSYNVVEPPEQKVEFKPTTQKARQQPAVKHIIPTKPSLAAGTKETASGLLNRLWSTMFGTGEEPIEPSYPSQAKPQTRHHPRYPSRGRHRPSQSRQRTSGSESSSSRTRRGTRGGKSQTGTKGHTTPREPSANSRAKSPTTTSRRPTEEKK